MPLSLESSAYAKAGLFFAAKGDDWRSRNATNVTYYDTVHLDLGYGLVCNIPVGFTEGLNAAGLGLLGQAGFFENFNVEFLHRQKIFTIERS